MTAAMDFLVALAVSALAGMGVGGGGLLVIWLVFANNFPTQTAQGINLLFFLPSALAAMPLHLRCRRIPRRYVTALTLSALPGVFTGCHLAQQISADAARRCFGFFLLVSGLMILLRQLRGFRAKR